MDDASRPDHEVPPSEAAPEGPPASRQGGRILPNHHFPQGLREEWARRDRRRDRQRRRRRRNILLSAVGVVFLAFVLGYFLEAWLARPRTSKAPVATAAQRDEGLRLIDEAAGARYAGRLDEAMSLATQAREADPTLPGIDVLIGEIALEQRDMRTLRAAANEALRRGHNAASARLLLAVETWAVRPADAAGSAQAGETAAALLSEAAMQEPSSGEVLYFWGELDRMAGRLDRAHQRQIGGVLRLQPWRSSTVLEAKMQLAAAEAGATPPDIIDGQRSVAALLDIRRQLLRGAVDPAAVQQLLESSSAKQAGVFFADVALRDGRKRGQLPDIRPDGALGLPHASVEAPKLDDLRPVNVPPSWIE